MHGIHSAKKMFLFVVGFRKLHAKFLDCMGIKSLQPMKSYKLQERRTTQIQIDCAAGGLFAQIIVMNVEGGKKSHANFMG